MRQSMHRGDARGSRGELDRREFMKLGAAGLAAAAAGGCARSGPEPGGPAEPWWVSERFELEETSIAELAEAMAARRLTSREVTRLYLDRIAALDRDGAGLRSILETNPEAEEIADRLDAERRSGRVRGPLHGVPIVVKDNLDTADRMTTTAGSYALEGHVAARDSHVVARLREAGAVVLAKANLSEWANFRSTRSSSGWSARGGQCRNAFALDRNPCGSSSGSAAAVSASFCAGAIGTETDGSIVCPSSVNGIVGLKPTVGLVSRAGIIPIAHTQDTAGPMTRSVRDAALLLSALAGPDPRDAATAPAARFAGTDYTSFLDAAGLRGARIGVERGFFGVEPAVDALMEEALRVMSAAGATIVDPAELATRQSLDEPELTVLMYEFAADLASYLREAGRPNGMGSVADLIRFNREHADVEMPWFGQEIFEQVAALEGGLESRAYREALERARTLSRDRGIDAIMERHDLDAIVAPTTRPAWKIDLVNSDLESAGASGPAAVAGYPSITVPNGYVSGLPVGILFFGRAWSEPTLLRIAYAYEQAAPHRRPARMHPTLDPAAA
ncbi:MAG TPA: amidase [Longimicrobiales bacterium]|nr:amidase [Longimicrobiales bacterium]